MRGGGAGRGGGGWTRDHWGHGGHGQRAVLDVPFSQDSSAARRQQLSDSDLPVNMLHVTVRAGADKLEKSSCNEGTLFVHDDHNHDIMLRTGLVTAGTDGHGQGWCQRPVPVSHCDSPAGSGNRPGLHDSDPAWVYTLPCSGRCPKS